MNSGAGSVRSFRNRSASRKNAAPAYRHQNAARDHYYAKKVGSPTAIWRVPVDGGEETPIVEGLSHSLNFVVANRGLYFVAVGDAPHKTSIDFFEFETGTRTTQLNLGKQSSAGMALSPDQQSLLYSVVDSAGSNLILVDKLQ